MSDVTILGLGNMGAALARALLQNGRRVTVWNRNPEKVAPLMEMGALPASSAKAAVAASRVIIVCVTNYAASDQILGGAGAQLAGKLLVQATTGSPQEARVSEAWAQAQGAEYLDCAITGSPASVGMPDAHILVSGREISFRRAEPTLRLLAGNLDYKGEAVGLASAWEMIYIMHYYGMFLSLFHSVQICQAEDIPLEEFITLLGQQGKEYEKWLCGNIQADSYQETSSPLELWAGAIKKIAQHARDSRIDTRFTTVTERLFQEAMHTGYGREEVSALFKVLQQPS